MIKLIVGKKGSGKTKTLIEMVNNAAENSKGNVVCIEKGSKLTYDLKSSVRLIDTDGYKICSYEAFVAFISGLLAGNYDITEIFIDSVLKIGGSNIDEFAQTVIKLEKMFTETSFVLTVSADNSEIPEAIRQYIIQ